MSHTQVSQKGVNKVNLWDDFWKFFFPLPGGESPREMLFRYVLEDLLKPKQIDLYTEQYVRVLSFFATLLLPILILGFVASLIQCMTRRSFLPFKRWVMGAVYVVGLVVVAPFVFTFGQYFFALIGSGILSMMMNTDDIDAVLKVLMQLTGDPNIDAALGLIQIILLVLLALELKLVVVALYISAIAVMIGLTLRFLPWIGEPLFAAAIKISVFGMFGYLYVLFALALIVGGGRILTGNNAWATGLFNVCAIGISVTILWKSISNLFGQLNAVVQGAIQGYQESSGRPSSRPDGGNGSGPNKESLIADEAADHLKGTRHGHGSASSASTDPSRAGSTAQTSGAKGAAGKGAPTGSSHASATAKRLATEAAKKAPHPAVQTAARTVDAAEKIQTGAAIASKGTHTQPGSSQPVRPLTAETSSRRHGETKPKAQATAEEYQLAYFDFQQPVKGKSEAQVTTDQYQQRYRNPESSREAEPPRRPQPTTPRHRRAPERNDDS